VDFSAEWYERQITNLGQTIVIVIVLSLLLGGLIVFLVAAKYRKRFDLLYTEMNRLSDGIEELISEVSTEEFVEDGERTSLSSSELPDMDEIDVMGNRIRELQDRLSGQISLIRTHAYTDGLTGMGNRAAYEIHVKSLQKIIREERPEFSIAIFDINQLKLINDDYGHEEGDRVIREAARALKEAFVGAEVYRIGGDEFVVLQEAGDVAVPFEAFDRLSVGKVDSESGMDISLSGGYAVFRQESDQAYSDVFIRADKAMYDDKRLYYQFHKDRRSGE
jgi:diguanylate cyclase (GGDEF)-like protein